jgi:hypothetical protein
MLLERGMDSEALAAFEATTKKEPNRFNAFSGAAKAADRLGDKVKAKDYFQKLTALASSADSVRPDLGSGAGLGCCSRAEHEPKVARPSRLTGKQWVESFRTWGV